jgi:hypothetical protein
MYWSNLLRWPAREGGTRRAPPLLARLSTWLTLAVATAGTAATAAAQTPDDPFPDPIPTQDGVIEVRVADFARLPDVAGSPARAMHLVVEAGTQRIFVVDMRGPLYTTRYDGSRVSEYVDLDDWISVEAAGRERGVQSFAFHPHFGVPGEAGYGRFYVWTDTDETAPAPDFAPGSDDDSHDTVLLEFRASDPAAATYDGNAPRELMRFQQPYGNHNGGQIAFNPLAEPGHEDFGLLYMGIADGGSGGDPLDMAQDLASGFGKILRVDPLGSESANGAYGIPPSNPFVDDEDDESLGEIWAYGVRNPQRFAWDSRNGRLFVTDIGQNTVEEISIVTRGANLGWNEWEGSFRYAGREGVDPTGSRSDADVTYPVAEYDQNDPLLGSRAASTGLIVYRSGAIEALRDRVLWGDLPSGEIFYFSADDLPEGGQAALRRVLLHDGRRARRLFDLVQVENQRQGRSPAARVDLRMSEGPHGEIFLLNKHDGVIRVLRR